MGRPVQQIIKKLTDSDFVGVNAGAGTFPVATPSILRCCCFYIMPDKAYLYPDAGSELPAGVISVDAAGADIGRGPESGVQVSVESVSRRHARLQRVNGAWLLSDLKSSNGTFVNGEPVTEPRVLRDGDILTFGKVTFTFRTTAAGEDGTGSDKDHTSGLRLVGDEEDSSVILSTQVSDQTPFKTATAEKTAEQHMERLNQRLLALYRLSDILRGASQREHIMASLMELIFENLPADRGVLLQVGDDPNDLEPEMFRYREGVESREFILSRSITRRSVVDRVAVLSRDVRMDKRFQSSESIMASDIRSAMCVPLAGKRHLMGLLFLDTSESVHAFSEDDLAFVSALATDAAMTLENLALVEENIRQERLAAVGQTISGMAHNIKNILQLARGGTELMEMAIQKKNFEEITTLWPITRRSIDRMQALTQEMLDFSRQAEPELSLGDVNKVIRQLAQMVQSDERTQLVELRVDCDDSCGHAMIDEDGLTKSLMNLLTNALDALQAHPHPEVLIGTENQKSNVMIRVRDNGPGIPPDLITKIFQPFFSTKGSKGNGLGLSMTRKYVEDMGGRLQVKSSPGQGSEFLILLPVDHAAAPGNR